MDSKTAAAKKKAWQCVECPWDRPEPLVTRERCQRHRDRLNAYQRKVRDQRRAEGKCDRCRQAPREPGKGKCRPCYDAIVDAKQRRIEADRRYGDVPPAVARFLARVDAIMASDAGRRAGDALFGR